MVHTLYELLSLLDIAIVNGWTIIPMKTPYSYKLIEPNALSSIVYTKKEKILLSGISITVPDIFWDIRFPNIISSNYLFLVHLAKALMHGWSIVYHTQPHTYNIKPPTNFGSLGSFTTYNKNLSFVKISNITFQVPEYFYDNNMLECGMPNMPMEY